MLSHANLLANARSCLEAVRLRDGDRLLLFLPCSIPHAARLPRGPVLARSASSSFRESTAPPSARRSEAPPTIFLGVPAIYAAMAEAAAGFLAAGSKPRCGCTSAAGAPLSSQVLRRFEDGWRRPLCEGYGLSEASPVVCFNPADGVRKPGSVGVFAAGVDVPHRGRAGRVGRDRRDRGDPRSRTERDEGYHDGRRRPPPR